MLRCRHLSIRAEAQTEHLTETRSATLIYAHGAPEQVHQVCTSPGLQAGPPLTDPSCERRQETSEVTAPTKCNALHAFWPRHEVIPFPHQRRKAADTNGHSTPQSSCCRCPLLPQHSAVTFISAYHGLAHTHTCVYTHIHTLIRSHAHTLTSRHVRPLSRWAIA